MPLCTNSIHLREIVSVVRIEETKKKRGKCEREREEIYFISVSVSFKCEHFLISHPVKGCQRHIFSVWLNFEANAFAFQSFRQQQEKAKYCH